MDNAFTQIILAALLAAISAMWARITMMQRRVEELVAKEAECKARLDTLQRSLEQKHEENQQAIASLYCKREEQCDPNTPAH